MACFLRNMGAWLCSKHHQWTAAESVAIFYMYSEQHVHDTGHKPHAAVIMKPLHVRVLQGPGPKSLVNAARDGMGSIQATYSEQPADVDAIQIGLHFRNATAGRERLNESHKRSRDQRIPTADEYEYRKWLPEAACSSSRDSSDHSTVGTHHQHAPTPGGRHLLLVAGPLPHMPEGV